MDINLPTPVEENASTDGSIPDFSLGREFFKMLFNPDLEFQDGVAMRCDVPIFHESKLKRELERLTRQSWKE